MSEKRTHYYIVATTQGDEKPTFYAFYNEVDAKKRYVDSVQNRVDTRSLNECVFFFTYPISGLPLKPHTCAEIDDDIVNLCKQASIRYIGPDVDASKWDAASDIREHLMQRYSVIAMRLMKSTSDVGAIEELKAIMEYFDIPIPEMK